MNKRVSKSFQFSVALSRVIHSSRKILWTSENFTHNVWYSIQNYEAYQKIEPYNWTPHGQWRKENRTIITQGLGTRVSWSDFNVTISMSKKREKHEYYRWKRKKNTSIDKMPNNQNFKKMNIWNELLCPCALTWVPLAEEINTKYTLKETKKMAMEKNLYEIQNILDYICKMRRKV